MKKQEKKGDHTMIQILVITVLCFVLGIAVMENMGMRDNVDINKQQTQLLQEQMILETEIKQFQGVFNNEPNFIELGMSVNKKQIKNTKNTKKSTKSQKSEIHIQKPLVDKKEYKFLKLENKLKVLLIRDMDTKMASAALNVNAGSWSEPLEFPGLAHFLEHMLFQGSVTYSENSYFEQMIAKGGGNTNAYTEGMRTNYYFSIECSKVYDALDVFAHFFIDPLLSEDMVQKEANAVNSEYEINVNGDNWKILHLLGLISDPNHPMSRFTIGNLQSLLKPHVVEALKKFHSDFYSSNQMALVVRSNIEMSEMEEFIKKSEFNKIKNNKLKQPSFAHLGLPIKEMAQVIKYHINARTTNLLYIYQLDDGKKYFRTKPIEFINNIVKSRHEGGLYDYLVSRKLAIDMDAQSFLGGNGSFMFYVIEAELDSTLIGSNKDNALLIAQAIVSYFEEIINQFYDSEMNGTELLREQYATRKAMSDMQFKYLEQDIDIFKLSHNLNTYEAKYVLNADRIFEEYKPNLIYNYLADLMNPNNMIIMIGDDGYQLQTKNQQDKSFLSYSLIEIDNDKQFIAKSELKQTNLLYQLQYDTKTLQKNSLDFISEDNIPLTLPQINHYIPKSLAFKSICQPKSKKVSYIQKVDSTNLYDHILRQNNFMQSEQFYYTSLADCKKHEFEYESYNHFPQLIQKNLKGKVWWRLDRMYSPTVYLGLNFDTAIDMKTTKKQALINIFNNYIVDTLKQSLQQSFEAGYTLSFDSTMRGLSLEMYGWSDKFDYFYQNVLTEIRKECNNQDILDRVKGNLINEQANIYEQKLFIQATSTQLPYILSNQPTPQQLIEEISTIQQTDLIEFQKEILNSFRFTSYFTGNILRNDVESMTSMIHKIFDESTQEIKVQNHNTKIADLTKKSIQYIQISRSSNKDDTNGVTLNYYQIGQRDLKSYSLMNLLSKILQNAAYGYLRTQLQLGYVVSVRFRPVGCLDSAQILVQGTAQPPYIVNQRIEEFLITYARKLREMTDQQFDDLKQTTIAQMKDNEKNLKDKARSTWSHIKYSDLAFEEKEVSAAIMETLNKEDLFEFYDRVFNGGKLSLQIYGQGMISQTMNISTHQQFFDKLRSEEMNKDQTYAVRQENTVVSQDEFKQRIRQNFNCNYRISMI